MGVTQPLGDNIITTSLDSLANWARKSSIWPMNFGLACCAIEMMATGAAKHDLDRFGIIFRASPRQADCIIIGGTVTKKMLPVSKTVYEQMPEPKWVVAMGACACSGGVFDTYSVVQGIDEALPVDVYIPGCPPRPDAMIYGLMALQQKIMGKSGKGRQPIIINPNTGEATPMVKRGRVEAAIDAPAVGAPSVKAPGSAGAEAAK